MTDLIKDLQKQNPGSAIVELYEIELDTDITTNTTAYFHRGLENNMTTIKFRSATKGSVSVNLLLNLSCFIYPLKTS